VQTAAGAAPLSSVFFGGGTPSLVPPPLVGRILDALRTRFALSATAEVSMEMDPVRFTTSFWCRRGQLSLLMLPPALKVEV